MDESLVKKCLDDWFVPMGLGLGLWEWDYEYTIEYLPDCRGLCKTQWKYKRLNIVISPDSFSNEEELKETVLHELFHVMHSAWTLVDECTDEVCGTVRSVAQEDCQMNLFRMCRALGITHNDIIQKGRKYASRRL